jgi:hypothetical protein
VPAAAVPLGACSDAPVTVCAHAHDEGLADALGRVPQAGMPGSGTIRRGRSGQEQQFVGAPGRLFGLPVPWLCHRPALQASRQHLDGLGEQICLCLEPAYALLHRGRAG